MIIPPSSIINNVSSTVDIKKQVQSAGIDLTVQNIFILNDGGELDFDNSQRFIPDYVELPKSNNCWVLQPGGYVVQYNEIVKVPLNMAAILLPPPCNNILRSVHCTPQRVSTWRSGQPQYRDPPWPALHVLHKYSDRPRIRVCCFWLLLYDLGKGDPISAL